MEYGTRRVAALHGDGHIRPVEQKTPDLKPGSVRVEVHASLVSPGTEVGGWRGLAARRNSPDAGSGPKPFGYSNSGVILEVGQGVTELQPGDRVACIGAGYAQHTDFAVVPHNLTAKLPDSVTHVQGAYSMLMATALHALRRADIGFGGYYGIVGLGLLGQLAAQLHRLAGHYVIGWDHIEGRTSIAKRCGAHATVTIGKEDPIPATRDFTGGFGLDGGLVAFGGDGSSAMQTLSHCLKRSPDGHRMGTVVVVGNADFSYKDIEAAGMGNVDIRRAARTGPGYHDEGWELGDEYPSVFMRWTTTTNLELCLKLVSEGKIEVDALTTHTIPFDRVDELTSEALQDPDSMLGVVFVQKS